MQQLILLRLVLGDFSLGDEDVEIITPANGALQHLPTGVGSVLLTLGPETKGQSSR
jgi:hypothetical protein